MPFTDSRATGNSLPTSATRRATLPSSTSSNKSPQSRRSPPLEKPRTLRFGRSLQSPAYQMLEVGDVPDQGARDLRFARGFRQGRGEQVRDRRDAGRFLEAGE